MESKTRDYDEGTFDLYGAIEEVMSGVSLTSTLWGDDVAEKEDDARKYFGIPRNDEVFLILDTTLFGSCKVGLALTTSGVCLKDEDGASRRITWEELFDGMDYSYEDGTLEIDGHRFFSSDGEHIVKVLDLAKEAYGEGDGTFDLYGIVEGVMDGVDAPSIAWGDNVDEKEDAARKYFGVPRDDDVYLILDTTLFGSCKVGLALSSSGICLKDEDGGSRFIDWGEFRDEIEFSYDGGTLDIDGHRFFSSDATYVFDVLEQIREVL